MKKFLSHKTRSSWKGFFFQTKKINTNEVSRNSTIFAKDIGKDVSIYNGKNFQKFRIKYRNVGYKFGQFFFTKKMGAGIHSKDLKKKKK